MKRNEENSVEATENTSSIALTEEQENEFVKAVKIGYYHAFYKQGLITAEQLEIDKARYPLGRYGEPIDIAHGIIYLLSDASSWVTGHSLVIDGGVTI